MPEQISIVQNCEISGKVNSSITRETENFENSTVIILCRNCNINCCNNKTIEFENQSKDGCQMVIPQKNIITTIWKKIVNLSNSHVTVTFFAYFILQFYFLLQYDSFTSNLSEFHLNSKIKSRSSFWRPYPWLQENYFKIVFILYITKKSYKLFKNFHSKKYWTILYISLLMDLCIVRFINCELFDSYFVIYFVFQTILLSFLNQNCVIVLLVCVPFIVK